LGWFNDINPLSLFVNNVFVKELQAIAIYFDGTPGVRFDQGGKVILEIVGGESIGQRSKKVVIRRTARE